jgi:hypothetical protein
MTAVRSSLVTACSIAVVAYAGDDVVHEIAGHYLTSLFVPGVRVVSLSTVALQTVGRSRLVAADGTIANLLAGAVALLLLRGEATRRWRITTRFFLWLFAVVNLMNGTGYLLFSGALDTGDWATVMAGIQPRWAWRAPITAIGLTAYIAVVYLVAMAMTGLVRSGLHHREVPRLLFASYAAGGLLFVAASALNPISPMLILTSGMSTAFGGMVGLLFVPRIVERMRGQSEGSEVLPFSRAWSIAGALVGIGFVAVLGPGVRF